MCVRVRVRMCMHMSHVHVHVHVSGKASHALLTDRLTNSPADLFVLTKVAVASLQHTNPNQVTVASLQHIFDHVNSVLERKGSMVIVVAEGAMQEFVATGAKDGTGHTVYGDIGVFLRDTLNAYLKSSEAPPASRGGRTFYIDPSYIIRSVPHHAQQPHLLHPTLVLTPTLTPTLTLTRCRSRPTITSTARA